MNERRQIVLVTGAAGFVGGHLMGLLSAQHDVVGWSRSDPPPARAGSGTWQRIDLLQRDRVRDAIRDLRPSSVYHCAGVTHVGESWGDTARPLEGNVLATHYLLDGLRRAGGSCRVLVPGSATVYAPSDQPIAEDAPLAPSSPYALSKLAQEQLGVRVARGDGLEVILTRSFNHTGRGQSASFVAPGMARQIARIERGEQPPVIRVGNLDARRDLTDVRDVVRAYVSLIASGQSGTIYNVASGTGRSIQSILDALIARSRVPVRVEHDAARLRPNDVPALVGDPARLREATGWSPQISFEQMMDDLLEYWRGVASATKSARHGDHGDHGDLGH